MRWSGYETPYQPIIRTVATGSERPARPLPDVLPQQPARIELQHQVIARPDGLTGGQASHVLLLPIGPHDLLDHVLQPHAFERELLYAEPYVPVYGEWDEE